MIAISGIRGMLSLWLKSLWLLSSGLWDAIIMTAIIPWHSLTPLKVLPTLPFPMRFDPNTWWRLNPTQTNWATLGLPLELLLPYNLILQNLLYVGIVVIWFFLLKLTVWNLNRPPIARSTLIVHSFTINPMPYGLIVIRVEQAFKSKHILMLEYS